LTGSTGIDGTQGPQGPEGKGAIIQLNKQWRALWCSEAPDSWFFDLVEVPTGKQEVELDPLFVEACVPGSFRLIGAAGAVEGCRVRLFVANPYPVTIAVFGLRVGMQSYRFWSVPPEVAAKNSSFWLGLLRT
jgi:hypothetical protein